MNNFGYNIPQNRYNPNPAMMGMNPNMMMNYPGQFNVNPVNPNMIVNPMMKTHQYGGNENAIFVSGLKETITENDLVGYFSKYGHITFTLILKDPKTQVSKKSGFVYFQNSKSASEAIENANLTTDLCGDQPIKVLPYANLKDYDMEGNIFIKVVSTSENPNEIVIDEKQLKMFFSKYGEIVSVKIGQDIKGQQLGYGYIQFKNIESAKNCLSDNNQKVIQGKEIEVSKYIPKEKREKDSVDKNSLVCRGIPKIKSEKEIIAKLKVFN